MERMKKKHRPVHCVSQGTGVVELTPPLTIVRIAMDLFQHRYYRLNKFLLTLIGQWPYQSARLRRGFLAGIAFFWIVSSTPLLLGLIKYRDDWSIVLDGVIACGLGTASLTKLIGIVRYSSKTLQLLDRMCSNWQVWARDREVNIFHEYAEQGEKMIILYTDLSISFTAVIYSTAIFYMTQPIIPKIIDVMMKNGTEPGKFPYPVDYYYFDAQKYYCYVTMHCYASGFVCAIALVADDTMLIMCVQHVCGVFAALGHKLEKLGNHSESVENGETSLELDKKNVVASLIARHNDAIQYANLIEATNRWIFFFIIGIGVIEINLTGLRIMMGKNDPESIIRYVSYMLTHAFIYYTECYISQILEDHSISIGYYMHNSRWYRLLPKTQKLTLLMTMRCRVPCQLTAGNMVVMSLRTFGVTLRTSFSYFAVFRSVNDGLNNE